MVTVEKIIEMKLYWLDSSDVNLTDPNDAVLHCRVVADRTVKEILKVVFLHQQAHALVMDERVDCFDLIVMDPDVKMVLMMDQMDEALVGPYPRRMIISEKKREKNKLNEFVCTG